MIVGETQQIRPEFVLVVNGAEDCDE